MNRVTPGVTVALLVAAAGCDLRLPAAPPPAAATATAARAAEEPAAVEVTAAAREAFDKVARDNGVKGKYWMRVFVVPGGCQGMIYKLDLDQGPLPATDRTLTSIGVNVVYAADQYPMIQGATVDYGTLNGKTGFKIETPRMTAANKEKTATWIEEQARKRPAAEPVATPTK